MPVVEIVILVTALVGAGSTIFLNLFQMYWKYNARNDNPDKPNYFTHISSDCCNSAKDT